LGLYASRCRGVKVGGVMGRHTPHLSTMLLANRALNLVKRLDRKWRGNLVDRIFIRGAANGPHRGGEGARARRQRPRVLRARVL